MRKTEEKLVKLYIWKGIGSPFEIRKISVAKFDDLTKFVGRVHDNVKNFESLIFQWKDTSCNEWITFSSLLEWSAIEKKEIVVRVFKKGEKIFHAFGTPCRIEISSTSLKQTCCDTCCSNDEPVILNILDFGAVGDGVTNDTFSIQSALNASRDHKNGAVIIFPSNRRYLTSPIELSSNTTVIIQKNAIVVGIQDQTKYPIIEPLISYGKTRDYNDGWYRYKPLFFGAQLHNVKITGQGESSVIDGQGEYWWNLHRSKKLNVGRPRLMEFLWSKNIEISGLTLQNSGFWTLHPTYCENVYIHDLKITSPPDAPNTDGINPDSSQNVLIERVTIDCGNDHIAIKSGMDEYGLKYNMPAKNIVIRNCYFGHGRGITIGSETSGGVKDVYVHNCIVFGPSRKGTFIKTGRGRGNVIENITYENIRLENVKTGVEINMNYCNIPRQKPEKTPIIRNITYKNIFGNVTERIGLFHCLEESPGTNVSMENINLRKVGDEVEDYSMQNVFGRQKNSCPVPNFQEE